MLSLRVPNNLAHQLRAKCPRPQKALASQHRPAVAGAPQPGHDAAALPLGEGAHVAASLRHCAPFSVQRRDQRAVPSTP